MIKQREDIHYIKIAASRSANKMTMRIAMHQPDLVSIAIVSLSERHCQRP